MTSTLAALAADLRVAFKDAIGPAAADPDLLRLVAAGLWLDARDLDTDRSDPVLAALAARA